MIIIINKYFNTCHTSLCWASSECQSLYDGKILGKDTVVVTNVVCTPPTPLPLMTHPPWAVEIYRLPCSSAVELPVAWVSFSWAIHFPFWAKSTLENPTFYGARLGLQEYSLSFLSQLKIIGCRYSLELPCGGSKEYSQSMFEAKNKENIIRKMLIYHRRRFYFT